jgi:hypothetical protein
MNMDRSLLYPQQVWNTSAELTADGMHEPVHWELVGEVVVQCRAMPQDQTTEHPDMDLTHKPEAWVQLPSADAVRAASGGHSHPYEIFMGGVIARMSRLLAAHPLIGPAFRQLSRVILFGPGALSRPEREMVAAVAAAAQDCFY